MGNSQSDNSRKNTKKSKSLAKIKHNEDVENAKEMAKKMAQELAIQLTKEKNEKKQAHYEPDDDDDDDEDGGIDGDDNDELKSTPFRDYLSLIKSLFGEKSEEFLIACLYSECTCKDDYGDIELIRDLDDNDNKRNFIYIHRGKATIFLNTSQFLMKLSKEVGTVVNKYVKKMKITKRFFNHKNGLQNVVINMNKRLGLSGGIDSLRTIIIYDILRKYKSTDERCLEMLPIYNKQHVIQAYWPYAGYHMTQKELKQHQKIMDGTYDEEKEYNWW